MTKKYFLMLFAIILVAMAGVGLTACGGDDEPSSNSSNDPEGVVMANIMNGSHADISDLSILLKNYNFGSYYFLGFDPEYLFVSVGKVKSIGGIKNIPTSGWTENVAAEVGYGYVIGTREPDSGAHHYTNNLTSYGRMYVEKTITGASGEILGYTVKVQYPWNP